MDIAERLEKYKAYVPRRVMQDLHAGIGRVHSEQFESSILFADISGFTRLTEQLAKQGPDGAEQLIQILNAYFGRIIEIIENHGGDVIKFAGDALLAIWPAQGGNNLADSVQSALQCGLAIQSTLQEFTAPGGTKLGMKIAVAAGPLRTYHLGGELGRCEFTVTGPALNEAGECGSACLPDEVVCAQTAWMTVKDCFVAETLSDIAVRVTASLLDSNFTRVEAPALQKENIDRLKSYIPAAVHSRLVTGQADWLAELRRVSVLFINLPDMQIDTRTEQAQAIMQSLQTALYRYEGSVNKLSVDDKGVSFLAGLGLPPLAHNDDPARAVMAALDMQQRLQELGWQVAIGISTGRVFCGVVGNEQRREYTLIGDTVNLAARLMQAAKGKILCDEATCLAASDAIEFEPQTALQLKGKSGVVANFCPVGRIDIQQDDFESDSSLIGRLQERQKLNLKVDDLHAGKSDIAVITGEAGIGKTALSGEIRLRCRQENITSLRGFASAIESTTPYFIWSEILGQVFSVDGSVDAGARLAAAMDSLRDAPQLIKLLPLLSDVFSLGIPDNETTAQISGETRADNINELLANILQRSADKQPVLLIIENAHWLDSASWSVLRLVARDVHPLLLLIITRPIAEPLPKTYRYFTSSPEMLKIELEGLEDVECLELVCQQFGVKQLHPAIENLIIEKSQGNPFYVEELGSHLLEIEAVIIRDDKCELADNAGDLGELNLPDTLEGLITERIDRLDASQQLSLKVASVIGHVFRMQIFNDIYPLDDEREHLTKIMQDCVRLDLVRKMASESDVIYVFRQYLTGEVAYNMLLYSQREQLHAAVADWYERHNPENLAPFYSLLVHHYSKVGDDKKTLEYCVHAGEQAIRNFANVEALEFYERALELDKKLGSVVSGWKCGQWHLQIAEVHYALANFPQSREHLQIALSLMGEPAGMNKAGLVKALLKEVFLQFMHRLRPAKYVANRRNEAATLLSASRAYERLAQIAYMSNDKPVLLHAALRALNLAEQAGISPELARSYANICVAASMVPSIRLAEMYYRLARSTAKKTGNLACEAYVLMVTAIYRTTTGVWQDIRDSIEPAIDIALRIGDRRRWDELMFTLAPANYRLGKHAASAEQYHELYESGLRRGILQIQVWGLCGELISMLPSGQFADTENKLELLDVDKLNIGDQVLVNGVFAQSNWQRGDERKAREYADRTLELVKNSDVVAQYVLEGLVAATDVFLNIWEQDSSRGVVLREPVKTMCKALYDYSRTSTVGLPQTLRCDGRAAWLSGKKKQAAKLWRAGLAKAEKFDMRYEQALLHYEMGRHSDGDQSKQHLLQARDSFDIAGAEVNYQQVTALLGES